ncbi:glucose transporter type 1 isoform X6 [Microplitis mediator]|uniref:glucose transporter type 1 isoform X6 n=1 Tax=Microplitis mediator TaxID=375433 RepID=UPI00255278FE|nr:glucose transporter type 1 isoform X6 [Microplitis mediator]
MADSRGFKPINLWSGDPDSECLYEEISGLSSSIEPERRSVGSGTSEHSSRTKRKVSSQETLQRAGSVGRRVYQDRSASAGEKTPPQPQTRHHSISSTYQHPQHHQHHQHQHQHQQIQHHQLQQLHQQHLHQQPYTETTQLPGSVHHQLRDQFGGTNSSPRVEDQYATRGFYGESLHGAPFEASASFKLTRGRTAAHYHHYHHYTSSLRRPGARPAPRYHFPRGVFSDETQEEIQEDDEATLRELLVSLQKQVSVMSMNLSAKLDELQQRGDRQLETTVALCEIRTQLQELTKSVESCQSEVSEVKRDMVAIKNIVLVTRCLQHELDTVQQVKEEIEELREYVDRLEEHSHRRKLRLLEQGLTFFLAYAIFAAVFGMLQFGYNTGVINAPQGNIANFMKDVYKDRYGEDMPDYVVKNLYSVAVSIFAIGGMIGGFSGGIIANRFGRKGGLLLNNVLGIVGACLMGFTKAAHSYEMLFLGRLIIGINCGLNTSLVPMYISEIAPLNLRGGLGTVNQLAVTIGLLISQVLGIEQILGTNDRWPVLLGLAVIPPIAQLLLLPICPESPRYLLITKQWEEEARRALRKLRASNQVEEDIEEMRAEERAQQAESTISMGELICSPTLRAPLVIGVVMQLSQQLSGINAVFYYSTILFRNAGLSDESAKFATIGIGAIMVGMTLVSIPLMDRTGRRTLHLYGLGGMFIFSIFITISFLIKEFFNYVQEMIGWMSYLSVVSTLSFVVFFAVGPGSIPWMITAELFSQGPRPAAMSIAVLVNWMANFVVGIGFPSMMICLDNYTFLPFSAFLAVFWIFTYKKVPETKNKTFEEILALFRHNHDRSSLRDSRLYGQEDLTTNSSRETILSDVTASTHHPHTQLR